MTINLHTELVGRRASRTARVFVGVSLLLCCFATCAASKDCAWLPSRALVGRIEYSLKLPGGASLDAYNRFYSSKPSAGKHIVVGEFLRSDHSNMQIVEPSKMPHVLDGGCSVVNLEYDVEKKKVLFLRCNGVG